MVGIAFVFGLIVMAMVYASGHLSGAHLNPAVTLAFALTRHFPRAEAVAYLLAHLGGPITGASMNPARSLGPALVSGELHDLWIYLTAPVLGAAVGAFAYQLVRGEHPREPVTEAA